MSELPEGIAPATEPDPRPSASGIVLRRTRGDHWRVLMGRRARAARFMPGNLVFPGGVVEEADLGAATGALATCATRELREETGVEIAVERWIDAGERVTPALFPVRFRNRFFVAGAPESVPESPVPPAPDEIERIEWADPSEVLGAWERGEAPVAPPMLPILRTLAAAGAVELDVVAEAIAETNAREERAPRIEFLPDIWALPVRSATLPPASHTNVWLPGGGRFAIVDPGSDAPDEVERLLAVVARRCELGAEPEVVLLTHHHRDHVGGAPVVARALGIGIRAHRATLERLPGGDGWIGSRVGEISEGDRVDLDGIRLRPVFTPGHAPGHLVFEVEGRGVTISGDLASGLSTILIDPRDGDMGDYLASLERVARSGVRTLLPGHGPPLPVRALERLAVHRRERERAVIEALASGRETLDAIAEAAYADTPGLPAALTELQALSHLIELERRHLARRLGDDRRWSGR